MERKDKRIVGVCIAVLVFLVIDFLTVMKTYVDYNESKASGNERWRQVEERMLRIERDVEDLRQEVEEWKS